MHKQYFVSDCHFGHSNIITFKDNEDKLCRSFKTIEEHDNLIIENINKVVRPCDKIYILGDVAMNRKCLPILDRIITKKRILIRGNHDCLDKETQCLTKRGWLNYKDLTKEDMVLSFDQNTKISHWKPINDIIIKKSNNIYKLEKQQINMAVTENHRVLINTGWKYRYVTPTTIPSTYKFIISSKSFNKDYNILDNEIQLMGWIISDGCFNKRFNKPYSINIYQSKKNGQLKIERILNSLNIKYSKCLCKKHVTEICGRKLINTLPNYVYRISVNDSKKYLKIVNSKLIIPKVCNNFSDRQAKIFISSLIDGDGSWNTNGKQKSCCLYGRKILLDYLQIFCIQHNMSASISVFRKQDYRLNIVFDRSEVWYQRRISKFKKQKYNNIVWCVSTPLTNFMVRRHGKTFFTGNCFKLKEYLPYFKDVRAYKVMPKHGIIFSHIPIHPCQLEGRFKLNVHGHSHSNKIDDKRYMNICPEQIGYEPIELEDILDIKNNPERV